MDQNSKRPSEPKGTSTTWFALIVVASLALCLFLVLSQGKKTLPYSKFKELINVTRYEEAVQIGEDPKLVEGYPSKITIQTRGRSKKEFTVAQPDELEISATEIRGTCYYYESSKSIDGEPVGTRVKFSVVKDSSDPTWNALQEKLAASNIRWQFVKPSIIEEYGGLMLLMAFMIGLFYFMLRRLGGAGGPMQFGRSRGKLYAEEDLGVSFSDVAGIDEAVEEVSEVVDFLKSPEKYQRLGGKIPCGVLLVGPPGTGKTLLAKAIAGEADVPFFSLSGSDFVEMFVGVGAARVRDMFQQAVAKAPCIIFIDELDALGKTRGGQSVGGHDEREQTLNALLVEMDGFSSNSGVIVMAATNRPETLDQALMRPGRFDRHVLVDRPDVRGREEILKVHVKNVKLDPNVDLKKVAAISPGFGGAELANLVNEAALLAARKEQNTVVMENFNEAVERVTAGLEKKQRLMSSEEKQRVAYHEAGHALVAYVLPNTNPVHKVSIIPRGLAALGYTMQRPTEDRYLMTKSELESELQILVAGTLAEELIYKDISTGASNDLERATDIARGMVMQYGMSSLGRVNYKQDRSSPFLAGSGGAVGGQLYSESTAREIDEEVSKIINEAVSKVRETLKVRKQALVALTDRLIEIESVDSDELKQIMDDNSPGPLLVPGTSAAVGRDEMLDDSSDHDQNDEQGDINAAQ
jgi:cell division protease FtsH